MAPSLHSWRPSRWRPELLRRAPFDVVERDFIGRVEVWDAASGSAVDHPPRYGGIEAPLQFVPSVASKMNRPTPSAVGRRIRVPVSHFQLARSAFDGGEDLRVE